MIVVCGEALMDVFVAGRSADGLLLDARIGGSPLNVAIGLARLGQPAAFFGAVGQGVLGERLVQALSDEGVDIRAVARVPQSTTLGLVGLQADGSADYAFYGEGGAERQLLPSHLRALPPARAYHFGSYAMVVPPVADTLLALAQRAAAAGALVAYDPNLRLGVCPNTGVWRERLAAMLPHTDWLKLSEDDLQCLYPGADSAVQAVRWLDQGVAAVLVTRGAAGLSLFTPTGTVHLPAAPGTVVDTVGAGDTVQAAVLAWLAEHDALDPSALRNLRERDWREALQFAARAAAVTCSRRGADLPRRAEL